MCSGKLHLYCLNIEEAQYIAITMFFVIHTIQQYEIYFYILVYYR